jgi:hypothetical protein
MSQSLKVPPHYAMAFMLLMINAVHFLIATYFQIPGNSFAAKLTESETGLQIIFYGISVASALLYSIIVRKMTLKYVLMSSLIADLIGLAFYWGSAAMGGNYPCVVIGTAFMGFAFLTVCISVVTYLVLEFPKKLGASLMAIFAFGDLGNIAANLIFDAVDGTIYGPGCYFFLSLTLCFLIWFIAAKFTDPVFPKHLKKMREGSVIWREFHYRLGFFLIAAIGYGIVESLFAVWGEVYLLQFLTQSIVTSTISIYWFGMMIGKFLLLVPLYFFSTSKVFPLLILGAMGAILYIEHQTEVSGFFIGFGAAGLFLAAVMPLIIASLENEIINSSIASHRRSYLPFVEIGTALIIGAHFLGVGIVVIFMESVRSINPTNFFNSALIISAIVGLIIGFLNWTFSVKNSPKNNTLT